MTITELKKAALRRLGIQAIAENPSAEDDRVLQEHWRSLHEHLSIKQLITFDVDDNVPPEQGWIMSAMLSARAAMDFECGQDLYGRLQGEGALDLVPPSLAERQLRKLLSTENVPTVQKTEYF